MQPVILASQSPRRKQLLEWAEIPFDIIVKHADEHYPPHLPVEEIPVFISHAKAEAVRQCEEVQQNKELSSRIIIAADTVVVLDNEIIGKPESRNHAIEILSRLSGRVHRVITGVTILYATSCTEFIDITEVAFHTLTRDEIIHYVDNYKPYDKAGAYAIQEWIGVVGIKSIQGDFYNVMGLPVSRVVNALKELL